MAITDFDPLAANKKGINTHVAADTYLKDLRSQLDAGKISVADFIKYGTPAAQQGYDAASQVAGTGSSAANSVKPYLANFATYGFNLGADRKVTPSLPAKYQQDAVNASLPTGLTDDQRKQFLNELPPGIDPFSDQGKIELEKARESAQQTSSLNQQLDARTQGLSALGSILQKQNQAQFDYDLPNIKEQLQGEGVYQSPSALANAVARESSMLGANTTATLGQYGLGNIDLLTAGLQGITQNNLGLQQSGLQRNFSTLDFDTQANLARQIGNASVSAQPKSNALGGALTGATSGAMAGGAIDGPWGAGAGALVGATAGGKAGR